MRLPKTIQRQSSVARHVSNTEVGSDHDEDEIEVDCVPELEVSPREEEFLEARCRARRF